MKINIGSKNKVKIEAARQTLALYKNLFKNAHIQGIDVEVELFGHPKNLKQTVNGAIKRAKLAYKDCDYSFGFEGGLIKVPYSKSGYMEVSACAVYDGKNIYLGLSPAYEWPEKVTELIVQGKADASKAFKDLGYTEHEKLGAKKGGITGLLTKGRLTREGFIKYSIVMALIHLENKDQFK